MRINENKNISTERRRSGRAVIAATVIVTFMLAASAAVLLSEDGRHADGAEVLGADFVPVTGLTDGPAMFAAGGWAMLTATVNPADATNQTIEWSVTDPGPTAAMIFDGNVLNTSHHGTFVLEAKISDGTAVGTDYTETFNVLITDAGPSTFNYYTVDGEGYMLTLMRALGSTVKVQFTVNKGYDASTLTVTASNGKGLLTGPAEGVYTYLVNDITDDVTIIINAEKLDGTEKPSGPWLGKAPAYAIIAIGLFVISLLFFLRR
jgi:hypothetical protein